MIKLWILTIAMVHGSIEYGYKFVFKENCEKVGKQYVFISKQKVMPSCKLKTFKIKDN